MQITSSHSTLGSTQPAGNTIGQRNRRPRLGQLLVEAGLVEAEALHNCLRSARRTHEKLGAILVNEKRISEKELQYALTAQNFIAEGIMSESAAPLILSHAASKNTDLVQAVADVDLTDQEMPSPVAELPELLVASGLITPQTEAQAQKLASSSGVSFGKALLMLNAITTRSLDAALTAIVFIRQGSVDKLQVVKAIRELRRNKSEVTRENLGEAASQEWTKPPVGEMFVQAKCLSDFECLSSIEKALGSKRLLGETLVQSGLVAQSVFLESLRLQHFLALGVVTQEQAAAALRFIEREGGSLKGLPQDCNIFRDDAQSKEALKLLSTTGHVTTAMVQEALQEQLQYRMDPAKALIASGKLSAQLLTRAKACLKHIDQGAITGAHARVLLEECPQLSDLDRAVERIQIPRRVAEERKQAERDTSDLGKRASSTFSAWLSYPEFTTMITTLVIAAAAIYATFSWVPEAFRAGTLWGVLLVASLLLVKTGHSWNKREAGRIDDHCTRVQNGRQTVTRLAKLNR